MNSKYGPRNQFLAREIDSVFLLVARIVEQLHVDAKLSRRVKCETYDVHPSRDCALDMLQQLSIFRKDNSEADHLEIAMEIISLHHA